MERFEYMKGKAAMWREGNHILPCLPAKDCQRFPEGMPGAAGTHGAAGRPGKRKQLLNGCLGIFLVCLEGGSIQKHTMDSQSIVENAGRQ